MNLLCHTVWVIPFKARAPYTNVLQTPFFESRFRSARQRIGGTVHASLRDTCSHPLLFPFHTIYATVEYDLVCCLLFIVIQFRCILQSFVLPRLGTLLGVYTFFVIAQNHLALNILKCRTGFRLIDPFSTVFVVVPEWLKGVCFPYPTATFVV